MVKSKMSDQDFKKCWTMLMVQTWAKDLAYDAAKESVQRAIYWDALKHVSAERWMAVVKWWLQHESRWPLLVDIKNHLARMFPPTKHEPLSWRSMLEAPKLASCEPWQSINVAYARSKGAESIFEIGVPILREYVRSHPHELIEHDRLAAWERLAGRSEVGPVGRRG